MEALSCSTFIPKFSENTPSFHSIRATNWFVGYQKINLNSTTTKPSPCGTRVLALARVLSDQGGQGVHHSGNDNGLASIHQESLSVAQGNSVHKQTSEKDADRTSDFVTPLVLSRRSTTGGGTRAGLFRTPISGGVQSTTSVHGLPRPALAVRNLMEQICSLSTVMSRMHHRREGYPFSSLVDFAPDRVGHPIFSFSPLAVHTRNLLADPRCTLVVQIPGWSGLSNARVTIFGDVFPLPEHQQVTNSSALFGKRCSLSLLWAFIFFWVEGG